MKRSLSIALAAAAAFAMAGCASNGAKTTKVSFDAAKDGSVVGYYTFEEAVKENVVTDHSAAKINAITGSVDGSVLVDGTQGKGLRFNGEDEFISLDPAVLSGSGFTFAGWVKADIWATWTRIFDFGDCKADVFFGVDGRTPGTLVLREETSQVQINTPLPEMCEWAHIAASFGDGKIAIYINGVLAAEAESPVTPAQIAATATGLYIGRSNWPDPLFQGTMDNIVLAKRSLTAEEIAYLASINKPAKSASAAKTVKAKPFKLTPECGVIGYYSFDEGVKDNEVVDHSAAKVNVSTGSLDDSVVAEGKKGKALVFNGSDEYVSLESNILEGDAFTIAMWVNPASWSAWCRIFDFGDCREDCWLGMDGGSGMLRFDAFGAKGNCTLGGKLPQIGKWTHVAVTLGEGHARLYIDGLLASEKSVEVLPSDIGKNATGIYIGRSNWPDPLFNGMMDEVLVANRVFTAEEIASVYSGITAK